MLFIRVSHHRYAIPVAQIRHVDYVEALTPLPFMSAPIEGLTYFKGELLVQVNLAQALGHENHAGLKRLIVSTPYANIALRVDEVLNFEKVTVPKPGEAAPKVLALDTLLPWTAKKYPPSLEKNNKKASRSNQNLSVLLVSSGQNQLALLTQTVDHIQEMVALETLERRGTASDLLIRIRDNLLPAYSLAQLLGLHETNAEGIAIIIRHVQHSWALLVEQVIGIERVLQVYSSGTDERGLWYVSQEGQIRELLDANHLLAKSASTSKTSAPRLWYVTPEGQIRELFDANQLLDTTIEPLTLQITEPELTPPTLNAACLGGSSGLRVDCGQSSYLLPIALVTRTLNNLDRCLMNSARVLSRPETQLPLLNAGMLFYGVMQPGQCTLLIHLANNAQLLVEVNQADLQPLLSARQALKLPAPASHFFDSCVYNEDTQQWLLQVHSNIGFAQLPWLIKKAIVKAIVGWFDVKIINEVDELS